MEREGGAKRAALSILYATDGSQDSLAGAHLLARLALTEEDQVRLVTVLPETGKHDAETALATARAALRESAAALGTEALRGNPADAILRAEAARPADLIVLGSRGLTGLQRLWVGSVAERVARHAATSVLVARPLVNDLRQAILGYDGSPDADRAVAWLPQFPLPPECELRITTVLQFLELFHRPSRLGWPAEYRSLYEQQVREAGERLAALVETFRQAGRKSEARLESGHPADTLLRLAEESRSDLIVVGERGLGGLERFLLGSVSEKVLRHAACSVLVVRH